MIHPLLQRIYDNRNYRFWACQTVGWMGYALGTFLTITVVDENISWPHLGHIALSTLLGMLISWPLRNLYLRTFDYPIILRSLIAAVAVIVLSWVWTVGRIQFYAWIANETAVWSEVHYWYFGSLFVFLSWTVLYYGIKYYDLLTLEHQKLLHESAQRKAEQLLRSQAETAAREAQLKMLRYQLNPHFLFNTLNAINALVRLKDNARAQEMIQLLSSFLRHSLDQQSVSVTLEQELESLMLYLDIEKARFEDRLIVDIDVDPAALHAIVPSFILQPIIENAMNYAIADSETGGTITIAAWLENHYLQLEVADTGPGISDDHCAEGRGIGLSNTRKRLETLYGSRYDFQVANSKPSGLRVSISLPRELPHDIDKPGSEAVLANVGT